jgi:hypothetical protein
MQIHRRDAEIAEKKQNRKDDTKKGKREGGSPLSLFLSLSVFSASLR